MNLLFEQFLATEQRLIWTSLAVVFVTRVNFTDSQNNSTQPIHADLLLFPVI